MLGLPPRDHKEIKRSQSNPKLYYSYLGIYDMGSSVMSIVREGDRLFAQKNGQKKRSLMEWAMRRVYPTIARTRTGLSAAVLFFPGATMMSEPVTGSAASGADPSTT